MNAPHHPPAAPQVIEQLAADGVDVVRVTFPDLIGIDRARDVLLDALPDVCAHGLAFCRGAFHTSPQGDVVPVPGGMDAGLPDVVVHPDLTTLVRLPWEPGVAWCLGDVRAPDGGPAPESPRSRLRAILARCADHELHLVVGPELEYFLLDPAPDRPAGWRRYAEATGNVYTAGRRGDPDGHLLRALRHLRELDLGATAANHEFCSGQFEINLRHSEALDAADRAFRFKTAVKEIARTEGRLATFMARPFNDDGGSGFHLHASSTDPAGRNRFDDPSAPYGLSTLARHAIAGVLAHAPALAAMLNPTINSYKRFGPDTLAPWLVDWGLDNRSAMLRVPPERGAGTRIELRLGDASANPYLAIAVTAAAMLLGIEAGAEPPPPLEGYGYDPGRSPVLPMSLPAALDALEADADLTDLLSKDLTTSYLTYKRHEVERFGRYVTDWEFTEYAYHL